MASAMRSRQQPAPRRSVASVNMRQSGTPKPSTPKRSRIARQQTSSQFSQNSQVSQSSAQSPAPQHPAPQPPATWTQSPVVRALPRPQPAPAWLKVLIKVQRLSSMPTLLLIIGLLAVYGWTVYTQQRWGQAYRHLEALQKQERQLTAASEVLKNQMAKQAEVPGVGLVLPDPGNTIYLTPAPQRSLVEPEVNLPPPQPIPARPLGY